MLLTTLETNLLFYKRITHTIKTKDYLKWAYSLVEADVESNSLYKVSSMNDTESIFVFEEYVNRALSELGISTPIFEECARANIYFLCKEVINNTRNKYDIVKDIFLTVIELDYPEELLVWLSLDEDIGRITYGDEYYKHNEIELRRQILVEAKRFIANQ